MEKQTSLPLRKISSKCIALLVLLFLSILIVPNSYAKTMGFTDDSYYWIDNKSHLVAGTTVTFVYDYSGDGTVITISGKINGKTVFSGGTASKASFTFNIPEDATGRISLSGQWGDRNGTRHSLSGSYAFLSLFNVLSSDPHAKSVELTVYDKVSPTCTDPGTEKYWECPTCKRMYKDCAGLEQISAPVSIKPLGHYWNTKYEWDELSTVTASRTCRRDDTHFETETAPVTSSITKQPSCEERGETTYTAVFENSGFKTQSKTIDDIDDLGGHVWKQPTYNWSSDFHSITATRVCERDDSHTETETVQAVENVLIAPTCEETGKSNFTASFENSAFEQKQENNIVTAALGHDWIQTEYTWSDDYMECIATHVCSRDGVSETEEGTVTVKTTPATTAAAGKTVYTAVFSKPGFTNQTHEIAIPKLPQPQSTEQVTLKKIGIKKLTAVSAKKLKVEWKKLSSKDRKTIQYIEVQVSTEKSFKTILKKKTVKSSKTSCTIPGLKKNTKYYVRIRAYTKSGKVIKVSKWAVKSKKTKKK